MPSGRYKNPQYGLRVPTPIMDKIKFIAEYNGRSANREIEQLMIKRIAEFEKEYGIIADQDIDSAPIVRRS